MERVKKTESESSKWTQVQEEIGTILKHTKLFWTIKKEFFYYEVG